MTHFDPDAVWIEDARKRWLRGETSTFIAKATGLPRGSIVRWSQVLKWPRHGGNGPGEVNADWPVAAVATVREMWAAGRSASEIGGAVGKSVTAVGKKVGRLGLPARESPIKAGLQSAPSPKKATPAPRPVAPLALVLVAPSIPTPTRFECLAPGELPRPHGCSFIVSAGKPWQYCACDGAVENRDGSPVRRPWCIGHLATVFKTVPLRAAVQA